MMNYTEKEKKVIEDLSIKSVTSSSYETRDYPNMICLKENVKIVLDLVEKQQEEIENLNNKYIHEKVAKEELEQILENSVSKDIIREKIDSYIRVIADSNDGYLKHDLRVRIKELRKLLGE